MTASRARILAGVLSIAISLGLAPPAALAADVVLTDNQLLQGNLCLGATCADGEAFGSVLFHIKRNDTPAIRLNQVTGAFTPQIWDIGGNEANFFVRDLTGGSRLPFRVRPGAITSQIDLRSNGVTDITGIAHEINSRIAAAPAYDETTILPALRTLAFERYTITGNTGIHFAPSPTAFQSAFALGVADKTAYSDMSSIALAAVKQLDERVTAIQLTPGPQGIAGAAGAKGDTGAAGAAGAPETPASNAQLAAANRRIAALERANKSQSKALVRIQKQLKALLAER